MNRIFIHGLESSNQGTKAVYFREQYPDMILPTFEGPLPERMEKLRHILAGKSDIRIVGSSFGGLMATLYAMENGPHVTRMVLLAPALNMIDSVPARREKIAVPAAVYHGANDDVIPLTDVQRIAGEIFTDLSFHVVDDDHFLHNTFTSVDWNTLLM